MSFLFSCCRRCKKKKKKKKNKIAPEIGVKNYKSEYGNKHGETKYVCTIKDDDQSLSPDSQELYSKQEQEKYIKQHGISLDEINNTKKYLEQHDKGLL